jgi:hypothetical protein
MPQQCWVRRQGVPLEGRPAKEQQQEPDAALDKTAPTGSPQVPPLSVGLHCLGLSHDLGRSLLQS